jgi:hypothetical protein
MAGIRVRVTSPGDTPTWREEQPEIPDSNESDFDKVFRHAVEFFGSEQRVRAMLKAGTLTFKLPRRRQQPEPGRPWGRCGAYARSTGKPCSAPGTGRGGRCKLHGGMSTGPRTEEGLKRLEEAMKARWRAWCASKGLRSCPLAWCRRPVMIRARVARI